MILLKSLRRETQVKKVRYQMIARIAEYYLEGKSLPLRFSRQEETTDGKFEKIAADALSGEVKENPT
jgi:hypothetical protein